MDERQYTRLEPEKIIRTMQLLEQRIAKRFPDSGVRKVCRELQAVARVTSHRLEQARKPHLQLRVAISALLIAGIALLYYVGTIIEVKRDADNLFGVLQGIDSAFNILIVMGAAALFMATLESRWKRQKALDGLHELRSLIHVIDMHQLTKDPSGDATIATGPPPAPQRQLTSFELVRYLDYCSEMLSLAAKLAALYAQDTRDPVVLATESELAQITSNMSGKIWQKITIVQSGIADDRRATPVAPPPPSV